MSDKPVCIFQSPMWTRSGYGDLGLSIAKSLMRYGKFDVKFVPTRWGGCSRKYMRDDLPNEEEKIMFDNILRGPLAKQPELFIQCSIPNEFQPPAKYNIGITAGIETTMARGDWVEGLNRMNFNIVTSEHAKNVFESATYQKDGPQGPQGPKIEYKSVKPIEVLFWGADTSVYHETNVIDASVNEEFNNIPDDFCFLFVGQWTNGGLFSDRKDIGNLIRTFFETFSGDFSPKPALIVKTSGAAICNMDKYDIINRIKSIKSFVETTKKHTNLPNVYLMYGDLTEQEMNSLYNHPKVKAHISFTHGEGFGHPLLLSTLSGKPLLVPNWSGHLDFLDKDLCTLLPGELKPLPGEAVNEWLLNGTSWFNVDYAKAAEKMTSCVRYYKSFKEKAEQLRARNSEAFANAAMDKKFHAILDKYVPKFATETKLVLPKLKKVEMSRTASKV